MLYNCVEMEDDKVGGIRIRRYCMPHCLPSFYLMVVVFICVGVGVIFSRNANEQGDVLHSVMLYHCCDDDIMDVLLFF